MKIRGAWPAGAVASLAPGCHRQDLVEMADYKGSGGWFLSWETLIVKSC